MAFISDGLPRWPTNETVQCIRDKSSLWINYLSETAIKITRCTGNRKWFHKALFVTFDLERQFPWLQNFRFFLDHDGCNRCLIDNHVVVQEYR